jgi:hypothetical protein
VTTTEAAENEKNNFSFNYNHFSGDSKTPRK